MRASVGAALTPLPNLSSSFAAITDCGLTADASKSFIAAVIAEPNAITLTRDLMMSLITPEIIRDKFDMSNAAPSIAPILVFEYPSSVFRNTGRSEKTIQVDDVHRKPQNA